MLLRRGVSLEPRKFSSGPFEFVSVQRIRLKAEIYWLLEPHFTTYITRGRVFV